MFVAARRSSCQKSVDAHTLELSRVRAEMYLFRYRSENRYAGMLLLSGRFETVVFKSVRFVQYASVRSLSTQSVQAGLRSQANAMVEAMVEAM